MAKWRLQYTVSTDAPLLPTHFRSHPMIMTPSERQSTCVRSVKNSSACRPCARSRRGACLWASRATHKVKEALSFLAGRHMSGSRVKGMKKVLAECSHVLVQSGPSHVACFVETKKKELCVPNVLLRVVETFDLTSAATCCSREDSALRPLSLSADMSWTSRALSKGHIDSQRSPPFPSCSSIFVEKSGPRTRVRHRWSALFAPPPSRLADISLHLLCSAGKCESTNLLLKERFCCGIVAAVHAFSVFCQECVVFCTPPILSLYTVVHPVVLIDPFVGNLSVVAHLPSGLHFVPRLFARRAHSPRFPSFLVCFDVFSNFWSADDENFRQRKSLHKWWSQFSGACRPCAWRTLTRAAQALAPLPEHDIPVRPEALVGLAKNGLQ